MLAHRSNQNAVAESHAANRQRLKQRRDGFGGVFRDSSTGSAVYMLRGEKGHSLNSLVVIVRRHLDGVV